MRHRFRDFVIKRTCTEKYKDYHRYREYLRKDFHRRCAYCNLLDTQITTPYEIDHFVPEDVFKDEWPELKTIYANLIYACKKCNLAKSSQYKGDIRKREIKNELFYDPERTDYGTIFFRDENGSIGSDDARGRDMISRLKLYRPIHNFAWICELTKTTLDALNAKIKVVGKESAKGELLLEARDELRDYYDICSAIFLENYNNNKFTI